MSPRKSYIVDFLLFTVVLIWGFNFALMKLLYQYFHPIAFNAIRFGISSLTMLGILKLQDKTPRARGKTQNARKPTTNPQDLTRAFGGFVPFRHGPLKPDREDWRGILWLGFLGNTIYPFVFVLGLDRTKAGNAALLMALTPIFAFLIGVAMKREHFSTAVLTGIILSFGGTAAIVLFGRSEISFSYSRVGDLLMIAAAFCWAAQSVQSTRLLPKYGPIRLTVFSMVAGTVVLVPLSIPWLLMQDWRAIPGLAWLGLAYSALLSITYAYLIWAFAINTIGVAHTSVFNNVTPIVAMLAGWLLLAEKPSAAQFAGVVLVLVGVFMVRSRKPTVIPAE